MENLYKNLNEKFKLIKKAIFEESKLTWPSVYSLEGGAKNIMTEIKNSSIEDSEFSLWAKRNHRKLDIFVADLTGELKHDYEKENKRYHGKWQVQCRKLNEVIENYQLEFFDKLSIE